MGKTIVARWQDWFGAGLQHLVLTEAPDAIVAEAVVIGMTDSGAKLAAQFRIACDDGWRVRQVEAGVIGDDRRIRLSADGAGHWRDGDGAALPQLDGAIDVDLQITPFTNTLPIRRLNLEPGQSADLRVAYVLLPEFQVVADPQRYVCLEKLRRYRYESLDSHFVREIDVDADGLVVTYPGLFRRVP